MAQVVAVVLKLTMWTFGLVLFLFVLSYLPAGAASELAGATLHAVASILSRIPDILDIALKRAGEGIGGGAPTTTTVP